jgi:hypothetical protein
MPARGSRALRRNRLESADGGASRELLGGVVGHRPSHDPAGGGKCQRPYRKNEERNNDLDQRVANDPRSSLHSARILCGFQEILIRRRPQSPKSRAFHGRCGTKERRSVFRRSAFLKPVRLELLADDHASGVVANLVRQRMGRGCGPALWRASNNCRGNRYVVRRLEAVQRRTGRRSSSEVLTI